MSDLVDATDQVARRLETEDWLSSLRDVQREQGGERASEILSRLQVEAQRSGIHLPVTSQTPYVNTISHHHQPLFPGNRLLERRIKSLIRWNAMAMVVEANQASEGIGGHISTYASAATLLEIGFNHFFKGAEHKDGADLIYFQGHASPGIYARSYLEGRLKPDKLHNFRRELKGGLPSYPHPRLMPDYWQFPTVSMGLGPLSAIYQARFTRYLEGRGLIAESEQKVWAFLGDGEVDEPESLGAISLAARENLDNLIFVVNCNLQRLDGPVRGNGQIIQELEAVFRGVGWNVIKVLWGQEWDALLDQDSEGLLVQRMGEIVDGEYQKYTVAGGAYIREHFYGVDPRLLRMVAHLSDDELWRMRLGGHDPDKVFAAYQSAVNHSGTPTVILARTIKGYGLGESGEGRNITHQQKRLNEKELLNFRDRFEIPLSDAEVVGAPLFRPANNSPEITYLTDRRKKLGGYIPRRIVNRSLNAKIPEGLFDDFYLGSGEREASTTMVFVRMLAALMGDDLLGSSIVPIVPDEARTFGLDSFFREFGIYAPKGQLYEPVDAGGLLFYKESKTGQILQEGISEAGALASFLAAGTSEMTHAVTTIPFFIFYSMFGLQRVGDLVMAAADARAKGFLIGATSGRTTLNGEGLQHQDGHSQVLASTIPSLISYDPAFAYEIAIILTDGIRRMYDEGDDVFYYLTVCNENYVQPPVPDGDFDKVREGVLRGIYRFKQSDSQTDQPDINLFGSGAILNETLAAQKTLLNYGIQADVWSVTSYNELRRDAQSIERSNRLHPEFAPQKSFLERSLGDSPAPVIAVSDYLKSLPDSVAKYVNAPFTSLGTDGFGRSSTREELRNFFEISADHIVFSALSQLLRDERILVSEFQKYVNELNVDISQLDPATVD
jgi:pyruvate dehydrogenase E1 component